MMGAACSREEGRTVAALAVDEADESDALSSDMLKADTVRFLHDVCVSVVVWLGVHVLDNLVQDFRLQYMSTHDSRDQDRSSSS